MFILQMLMAVLAMSIYDAFSFGKIETHLYGKACSVLAVLSALGNTV